MQYQELWYHSACLRNLILFFDSVLGMDAFTGQISLMVSSPSKHLTLLQHNLAHDHLSRC